MNQRKIKSFQKTVLGHYQNNGRLLPWRPPLLKPNKQDVLDPYKVLVSEVMLQQTQAPRVVPKFLSFTKRFPSFESLAKATNRAVLTEWQGLGYNRRGLWLKIAAETVVKKYEGKLPRNADLLEELKGIGHYTARAIKTFIWNDPEVFIETNLRDIFLFHFFEGKTAVTDTEILALIEATLPEEDPRTWYYALMDYGTFLKKQYPALKQQAKHYKKQPPFKGSNRELRAHILRTLLAEPKTLSSITKLTANTPEAVRKNLETMKTEGLVTKKGSKWHVSEGANFS